MAKSTTASATRGFSHSDPCAELQMNIELKNTQLTSWQSEYEVLLNDPSNAPTIAIIRDTIDAIKSELVRLKTGLKKNNCAGDTEFSQDNQTVISSASVRRKDYR